MQKNYRHFYPLNMKFVKKAIFLEQVVLMNISIINA